MKIEIFIATQKMINLPLEKCYVPIFVGAGLKKENKGFDTLYIRDDIGNNISEKNQSYCELTALYWMWKNCDADAVGLMHYRRFLSKSKKIRDLNGILDGCRIEKDLEENDILLPKKECLFGNVKRHYGYLQHIDDYMKCRDIISELYPEYIDDFDCVSNQDEIYICNMFIGKKWIIDEYCQWLFDILFELEKRVDISGYSLKDKRIFGYLSERLFNVWLLHNKPPIKEYFLMNTEETLVDRAKKNFHLFNYKFLKIDVLKYAHERTVKREAKSICKSRRIR